MRNILPYCLGMVLLLSGVSGFAQDDPFTLGAKALSEKKYKEAIAYFNQAYRGDPRNPNILYNRALAKYEMGKLKKACIDWNRAKKLGDVESAELVEEKCAEFFR